MTQDFSRTIFVGFTAYNFRGVSFQSIYYLRSKIFRTAISVQALGTFLMISFGVVNLFQVQSH